MTRLLRVPHAAQRLGISERTLRRLIAARRIVVVRVSERVVRIEEDEVERYLEASRVPLEGEED